MKQFYELYKDNEKVSTLLTQLNWSNHLKIMSACKTMEERIFYMSMCVKEKYGHGIYVSAQCPPPPSIPSTSMR